MRLPVDIILWDEAKSIHKKYISQDKKDYFYDAFVCFYTDDHKFDGPHGIWNNCCFVLEVLKHFQEQYHPIFLHIRTSRIQSRDITHIE